MKGAVH